MPKIVAYLVAGNKCVCLWCATDKQKMTGWSLLETPRQKNYLIDLKCDECGVTI